MPKQAQMDDPFAGGKEIKPGKFSFGKIGDHVVGYFNAVQEVDTANGRKKLYEIKVVSGQYHNSETTNDPNGNKVVTIDEAPTVLEAGDYVNIWGRADLDKFFQKAKFGQKVGVQFKEIKPSTKKGYSAFKVLKTVLFNEFDNSMEEAVEEVGL